MPGLRKNYSDQMESVTSDFVRMGAMAVAAVDRAIAAVDTGDRALAQAVLDAEAEIYKLEDELEYKCTRLLMRQQPQGRDLRMIVVVLKMVTDLARIADAAAGIAGLCTQLPPGVPPDLSDIRRMAAAAREMVADAIQAHVSGSLVLADYVRRRDEIVNGYFESLRGEIALYVRGHPNEADLGLDYFLILKYFERLGDHAANIARWVRFYKTGQKSDMGMTI